jgi:hypothetical protein
MINEVVQQKTGESYRVIALLGIKTGIAQNENQNPGHGRDPQVESIEGVGFVSQRDIPDSRIGNLSSFCTQLVDIPGQSQVLEGVPGIVSLESYVHVLKTGDVVGDHQNYTGQQELWQNESSGAKLPDSPNQEQSDQNPECGHY